MGVEGSDYQICVASGGCCCRKIRYGKKMVAIPELCTFFSGLQDHFMTTSQIVDSSHNSKRLCISRETKISSGLCISNVDEELGFTGENVQHSGILQQVISNFRNWGKMETGNRSKCAELFVPTFKIKTVEVIRNTICKGNWVMTIDLIDAYFHIPIHKKSQHLLRFHVAGQSYQFQALPFSIAAALLEFIRVVKEVKLMLQNRGICIHQYLDNWLLRAPSEETCLEQSKKNSFKN